MNEVNGVVANVAVPLNVLLLVATPVTVMFCRTVVPSLKYEPVPVALACDPPIVVVVDKLELTRATGVLPLSSTTQAFCAGVMTALTDVAPSGLPVTVPDQKPCALVNGASEAPPPPPQPTRTMLPNRQERKSLKSFMFFSVEVNV